MSYPHAMRLAGPWEYQVLSCDEADLSALANNSAPESDAKVGGTRNRLPSDLRSGRMRLPADWESELGTEFRGCVRFERRFGRPRELDPHERLWLVLEGADSTASVALNGQPLGPIKGYAIGAEFDISALAEARNTLTVDVVCAPAEARQLRPGREQRAGGLIGEVRLEVRRDSFISNLSVVLRSQADEPQLHVCGKVEGWSSNLIVRVARHQGELIYGKIDRADGGFHFTCPMRDLPSWLPGSPATASCEPLEIALIGDGARLWETTRHVALVPSLRYERQRLQLGDRGRDCPLPRLPRTMLEAESKQATDSVLVDFLSVFVSTEILTEPQYQQLDEAGIGVVQAMPAAWAPRVCGRLAHHSAILAWTTTRAELLPGRAASEANGDDRLWLAWEDVAGGDS